MTFRNQALAHWPNFYFQECWVILSNIGRHGGYSSIGYLRKNLILRNFLWICLIIAINSALVWLSNDLSCLSFVSVFLVLKNSTFDSVQCPGVLFYLFTLIHLQFRSWLYTYIISVAWDVKVNPGLKVKARSNLFNPF